MLFVVMYLLEGLVLMLVSRPMIQRRIRPNRFYGFRTPKTLSSPDIWYPANEFSGRRLFTAGAAITLCSLLLSPLNLLGKAGFTAYTAAMVAIMPISLIGAVIASFRYLKRL
jgi:uncharacterized membrane protein